MKFANILAVVIGSAEARHRLGRYENIGLTFLDGAERIQNEELGEKVHGVRYSQYSPKVTWHKSNEEEPYFDQDRIHQGDIDRVLGYKDKDDAEQMEFEKSLSGIQSLVQDSNIAQAKSDPIAGSLGHKKVSRDDLFPE